MADNRNVTLNLPFVTTLLPVAPVPACGTTVNENVPLAPVAVRVLTVMLPLRRDAPVLAG